MLRTLLGSLLLLCSLLGMAQGDDSLTREFERMSPKERARIAKKEQEESAQDPRYQAVMTAAEDLFRKQQYDDALLRYQEARDLRPLNVYPKVKIQDLQALIAKREAALAAQAQPAEVPAPASPPAVVVEEPVPVTMEVVAIPAQPAPTPPKADTVKAQPEPKPRPAPMRAPVQQKPAPAVVQSEAPAGPDGVEERMYMEGRAVVMERKVTTKGRTELYRRVTHPWGQVNYFRDGIAISERVWQEAGGTR